MGFGPSTCNRILSSSVTKCRFGYFWAVKVVTGQGGEVPTPGNDFERFFTVSNALCALIFNGYVIGSLVNLIGEVNESAGTEFQ